MTFGIPDLEVEISIQPNDDAPSLASPHMFPIWGGGGEFVRRNGAAPMEITKDTIFSNEAFIRQIHLLQNILVKLRVT